MLPYFVDVPSHCGVLLLRTQYTPQRCDRHDSGRLRFKDFAGFAEFATSTSLALRRHRRNQLPRLRGLKRSCGTQHQRISVHGADDLGG